MDGNSNSVHKENIMLNLSATDKESVLSQMSDVLFQNGFVKSTFKDAVIDREKEFATGLPTHLMFGRYTAYRCRTY